MTPAEHAEQRARDYVRGGETCPCCLGPAGLVCDACGTHDCWAGTWMRVEAPGADVCTAAEYAEREQEEAS